MTWWSRIGARAKAAVLLSVILLGVLVNNHWERRNIERWDASFSSIYDDRLLPETYIFKLTDRLYKKRLLWSEAERPDRVGAVRSALDQHDADIGVLVKEFEATYLVEAESRELAAFKARWAACRALERQWLEGARGEHLGVMTAEFDQALHQLYLLSRIQEQVGQDLKRGSKSLVASSNVYYQLEMALLIIMALLIKFLLPGSAPISPGPRAAFEPRETYRSHLH